MMFGQSALKVAIRVDAASIIGTGHVMRCLVLARKLKLLGAEVFFLCRRFPGDMVDTILSLGYNVHVLPLDYPETDDQTAFFLVLKKEWQYDAIHCADILVKYHNVDWIIVDHYALDFKWEKQLKNFTKKIWVIDDLADRVHDCDVLQDQNYDPDLIRKYDGLLPSLCRKLLGPKYLLLRQEFLDQRRLLRYRDGSVKRIMIFFGGSDPTNETQKAINAMKLLRCNDLTIDVVVGMSNPYKREIENLCSELYNFNFYCQINNMAEMINNADLAIGAGGGATLERCYLGLPAIIISVSKNQLQGINKMTNANLFINLGWHENIDTINLSNIIHNIILDKQRLKKISENTIRFFSPYIKFQREEKILTYFWGQ